MTLDIDGYIMLDFGMKNAVRAHPRKSIQSRSTFYFQTVVADPTRLFHVVFSDDCYKVTIIMIDSEHRTVREFGLLQTKS